MSNSSSLYMTSTEANALGGFFESESYQDHSEKSPRKKKRKTSKKKLENRQDERRRYNKVDIYKVLRFIKSWSEIYSESPSLHRIAEYNGLTSANHAKNIALRLEKLGYIKYNYGVRRGIELLPMSDKIEPIDFESI